MLLRVQILACLVLGLPSVASAAGPALATLSDAALAQMLAPDGEIRGRCGTLPVAEMRARGMETIAAAPGDTLYFDTPEGHFRIAYRVEGVYSVDSTDVDMSGVPDYVELCGSAFERSWAVEIDSLGFGAPDIGAERYEVSTIFGAGYFGLTDVIGSSPGGTRIRIRYSMEPFCTGGSAGEPCETNALIVTIAHEFKHAIQVASGWSINQVGGWVELDATWMEDIVYDDSNDYYRFINVSGSPFNDPQISLMNVSYEDCTWERYLSENWSSDFLVDFSTALVAGLPAQPAQLAYVEVAGDYDLEWPELWAGYTVATYLSGTRAVDGMVFEEGSFYPQARVEPVTSLPADYPSLSLPDMAMRFHEYANPGGLGPSLIELEFGGSPGIDWTVQLVFQRPDQTVVVPVVVESGAATITTTEALADFDRVAVLVGNSRVPAGAAQSGTYSLSFRLSVFTARSSLGGLKGRFRGGSAPTP